MQLIDLLDRLRRIEKRPVLPEVDPDELRDPERLLYHTARKTVLADAPDIQRVLEAGLRNDPVSHALFAAFFGPEQRNWRCGGETIAVFCGGRGGRSVIRALATTGQRVRAIVNTYDDGRSTGVIRHFFDMPGPSDIRKNHVTLLASDKPAHKSLRILLEHRFNHHHEWLVLMEGLRGLRTNTRARDQIVLYEAFDALSAEKRNLTLTYLDTFAHEVAVNEARGTKFDFSDLSLGNCIYTGAYLYHGRSLLTSVRQLERDVLDLPQSVLPISSESLWLVALTKRGKIVESEAALVEERWTEGIEAVYLLPRPLGGSLARTLARLDVSLSVKKRLLQEHAAVAEPSVDALAELASASLIIYAAGTLHSSLLPSYMTAGVADVLRQTAAAKVLATNICADNETQDFAASDYATRTYETLRAFASEPVPFQGFFDYLLVNVWRDLDNAKTGALSRVVPDIEARFRGTEIIARHFEDPTTPGTHDGVKLARYARQLSALKRAGLRLRRGRLEAWGQKTTGLVRPVSHATPARVVQS